MLLLLVLMLFRMRFVIKSFVPSSYPNPATTISDKEQTLDLKQFSQLMKEIKPITQAVGRDL